MANKEFKTYFLSFANSDFGSTLERLRKQMASCDVFDECYYLSEKDLDKDFLKDFHPFIYRRGYGYWKWKAYIVRRLLSKLNEGDVLIYSDAGNEYNENGKKRLLEYIEVVRQSESGVIAFGQPTPEKDYTKADMFEYFGVADEVSVTETEQLWGGLVILKKNANSVELVERWNEMGVERFDLLTDKGSVLPNAATFIEHRHDQSAFSILAKLHNAVVYHSSEVGVENFANIPFLAKRSKTKYPLYQIKRYLLLPVRYLIGLYLVKVEGFYIRDRIAR